MRLSRNMTHFTTALGPIRLYRSLSCSVFENVQAMDEYGNAVEEGQKIRLRLDGFQFQDKQGTERKVF
jgi:hypothetical protein